MSNKLSLLTDLFGLSMEEAVIIAPLCTTPHEQKLSSWLLDWLGRTPRKDLIVDFYTCQPTSEVKRQLEEFKKELLVEFENSRASRTAWWAHPQKGSCMINHVTVSTTSTRGRRPDLIIVGESARWHRQLFLSLFHCLELNKQHPAQPQVFLTRKRHPYGCLT